MGSSLGARLQSLRETVRAGFWFIPAVATAAAAALAVALVGWQDVVDEPIEGNAPWLFHGEAGSARGALTAIATSVATVAGVTFSVTVVTLTLAAGQFSPRVLQNFVRDRFNQSVLAAFIATFAYALIVLISIQEGEGVPNVAMTVGVLLALASLGLLIGFIHHIAQSIQVSSVLLGITRETAAQVGRKFPEGVGRGAPPEVEPPDLRTGETAPVRADRFGYVQVLDARRILSAAEEADVVIRLARRPGDFVSPGTALASVWPAARASRQLERDVRRNVALARQPSIGQDPAFGIRQVADIAVKALSPGINDPTTAASCIDHLGVILERALETPDPNPYRCGRDGRIRLIAPGPVFRDLLHLAFDQIRVYGSKDARVLGRVLETLRYLGRQAGDPGRRDDLAAVAEEVARAAEWGLEDAEDRRRVLAAARRVMALRVAPPRGGAGAAT